MLGMQLPLGVWHLTSDPTESFPCVGVIPFRPGVLAGRINRDMLILWILGLAYV